jgi:hypothetical protein
MTGMTLPACGTYRTTKALGPVSESRLVYFHNHGAPGPGVYLPASWSANRAQFAAHGTSISDEDASSLDPLAPEGLYRVEEEFACCSKRCQVYSVGQLVQLGYDATAQPILFLPEWTPHGLSFPQRGQIIDGFRLARLSRLSVRATPTEADSAVNASDGSHPSDAR